MVYVYVYMDDGFEELCGMVNIWNVFKLTLTCMTLTCMESCLVFMLPRAWWKQTSAIPATEVDTVHNTKGLDYLKYILFTRGNFVNMYRYVASKGNE